MKLRYYIIIQLIILVIANILYATLIDDSAWYFFIPSLILFGGIITLVSILCFKLFKSSTMYFLPHICLIIYGLIGYSMSKSTTGWDSWGHDLMARVVLVFVPPSIMIVLIIMKIKKVRIEG